MAWKNVQYENGKYRTSEGGGGGGSSTFADLEDVSFSNLQDGQVPKYNSATQKWENANESGGGGTVTDVEVNGESVVNAQKVAEIKSYKEVTQAQYNALPDSKLNDGILYAIKDVGGSDGFPPLIYSGEEREVGVWRDGKPLYQRTFRGTTSSSDNAVSVYSDSEWNVVNCEGNIEESADKIQIGAYLNSSYYCGWYFDKYDSNTLKIFYSNQYKGKDYVITIYYTKATDIPGSGTWTTQGALAHHYSTDEHIIGTWIDGKPLYEKTIDYGNNVMVGYSSQVQTEVLHGISNIGVVVNLFIICTGMNVFNDSLLTNSDGSVCCKFRVDSTRIYASGGNNHYVATADRHWYFIIRYTKTTD